MTDDSTGGAGTAPDVSVVSSPAGAGRRNSDAALDLGDPWHLESDGELPEPEPRDWAWVEEWRADAEPVPWGPGVAVAGFVLVLVASAVYVLSAGLADHVILDIGVNILVAAGLGPALWLSRGLPVLRWIAAGAVVGVLAAWLSVLIFLT